MKDNIITPELKRYGFVVPSSPALSIFLEIPVYPNMTNIEELGKRLGKTSDEVRLIIDRMPPNAPVFYEDGEVGRWK